ncbi:MAG: hypothetical protein DMF71_17395 [Acidobacteria bacterium]|nr:MAG: hypothetical protein DMF71_17395 [Acidobacteriota bacterium]
MRDVKPTAVAVQTLIIETRRPASYKGSFVTSAAEPLPLVTDSEANGDAEAVFDCRWPCCAEQARTNSATPMTGRNHLDDENNDPSLRSSTLCIT